MKKNEKFYLLKDFLTSIKNMSITEKEILTELLMAKVPEDFEYLDMIIDEWYSEDIKSPDWVRMYTNSSDKNFGTEEAIEDIIGEFLTENEESYGNGDLPIK